MKKFVVTLAVALALTVFVSNAHARRGRGCGCGGGGYGGGMMSYGGCYGGSGGWGMGYGCMGGGYGWNMPMSYGCGGGMVMGSGYGGFNQGVVTSPTTTGQTVVGGTNQIVTGTDTQGRKVWFVPSGMINGEPAYTMTTTNPNPGRREE